MMRHPRNSVVAWAMVTASAASMAVAAALPDRNFPLRGILFLGGALLLVGTCGALVAIKRPKIAIGWILLGVALCFTSELGATQYAQRALVARPGSLPLGVLAAWLQTWLTVPVVALLPLLVLLFPTGSLPSRRWRFAAWSASLFAAVLLLEAFRAGPYETFRHVRNPVGFIPRRLFDVSDPVVLALGLTAFGGAIVSLFVRFRRSRGDERLQIKWFFFATVAAAVLTLTNPLQIALDHAIVIPGLRLAGPFVFPVVGLCLLPIAIATSVLRYRLYDIDRIISRTLSYALVTGCLIGTYVVFVVVFQAATRPLTGRSDLAVAASTLIVAASFIPLRRRVQSGVDHRFNRRRYDAEQTIEAFSARLRDEIDMEALSTELVGIVQQTMQPSSTSLWMRET